MPQFLLLIPMSADSFTFKQGNCFIFCHTDRILQLLDTCKRIRSVAVSSDRVNSELVLCLNDSLQRAGTVTPIVENTHYVSRLFHLLYSQLCFRLTCTQKEFL